MQLAELAIFTDNVEAATEFYERLLGTAPAHRAAGIAIFKVGDAEVLIHQRYEAGPGDLPCENHVAFAVADVDESVTELEARGLSVEIPAQDYEWGRSAYLRDPDGHLLEIHQEQPSG
jgi:catechol 2,3-dioxygenase-like lactoylglutathione lyase family enzyme